MNLGDYLQYMLALVFVLALIGLIAVGVKRFGIAGTIGGRRTARIAVLEAAPVDKRRRLLLIRRDNVEHLVMVGGSQDFVVESGIEHDPANRPEIASPLRSSEPPLTSREPVLQTAAEPARTRRSASARDDLLPAEPKLDLPRTSSAENQPARAEELRTDEPGGSQARSRKPEPSTPQMPVAPVPAAHIDGDGRPADAGSHSPQPDRAQKRNVPPTPASAAAPQRAPAVQENYGPSNPIRVEPKLHGRSPHSGVEPKNVKPEPKAQAAVQPKAQRRPPEKQQERAPAPPTQPRQARPQTQAEVSQRTRPQTPTAQPATGQRVEPTVQVQSRQPSRQPQAVTGNDPDLLILNDPVARPRRA